MGLAFPLVELLWHSWLAGFYKEPFWQSCCQYSNGKNNPIRKIRAAVAVERREEDPHEPSGLPGNRSKGWMETKVYWMNKRELETLWWVFALIHDNLVSLGKLLTLSEPQFSPLWHEEGPMSLPQSLRDDMIWMAVKGLGWKSLSQRNLLLQLHPFVRSVWKVYCQAERLSEFNYLVLFWGLLQDSSLFCLLSSKVWQHCPLLFDT